MIQRTNKVQVVTIIDRVLQTSLHALRAAKTKLYETFGAHMYPVKRNGVNLEDFASVSRTLLRYTSVINF